MIQNVELTNLQSNATALQAEMTWLKQVLDTRMALYFGKECAFRNIYEVPVPNPDDYPSIYADFIRHYQMNTDERLLLLIALAPHICPQLLDIFFSKNEMHGGIFTEFGGVSGKMHRGFLPTAETIAFVLAANDLTRRFQVFQIFDPDHFMVKQKVVSIDKDSSNEPLLSAVVSIGKEYLSYLTTGTAYKPTFNSEFPAARITTRMEWDDLVMDDELKDQVKEIMVWIDNSKTILDDWGLKRVLKRGYRGLFYGPPGTGKTLTASLLGKATGLDVYRVDISKMVSKYIGETEKNLSNIFDQAEYKNWILFFDEADALFGKRSTTSDSKDRYANQEVAYLLQRIEDFPGVVLLSTNFKSNIDTAFNRRFQSLIYFAMPGPKQRLALWKNAFKGLPLDDNVKFEQISKEFELSGGTIINVLSFAALNAVRRDPQRVVYDDILEGIRKEYRKEGKTV